MGYEYLRVQEFPENDSDSWEILPSLSFGVPGPWDEIPGAEFAKQGGPKPDKVYWINTREKVINDKINQLDTKLKNSAYWLHFTILIYEKMYDICLTYG